MGRGDLFQRRAQRRPQVGVNQNRQLEAHRAAGGRQILADRPRELLDLVPLVDDHEGRRILRHDAGDARVDRSVAGVDGRPRSIGRRSCRRDGQDLRGRRAALEQAVLLVERREQRRMRGHRFRRSQEQQPVGAQTIVEHGDDPLLQDRSEIDQEIAAGHQIKPREGWILDEVVGRKQAHFAQVSRNPVAPVFLDEVLTEQPLGQIGRDGARVKTRPGDGDGLIVDVGGEDLHLSRPVGAGQRLLEQDGDRIRFLAGGATGNPNPQGVVIVALAQQRRNKQRQGVEGRSIAEEPRDPDQHLAKQKFGFFGPFAQQVDIGLDALGMEHLHASLHAPHDGVGFVLAEITPKPAAEHRAYRSQMVADVPADAVRALGRVCFAAIAPVLDQDGRHPLNRQDVIDEAAGRRALGHAGLGVLVEVRLSEGQAAALFDGLHARGAVAAVAGQNHPDRVLILIVRQRCEEGVDRRAASGRRRRPGHLQNAAGDGQDGVGGNHIDVVRCNRLAGLGLRHRHRRHGAQNVHQ